MKLYCHLYRHLKELPLYSRTLPIGKVCSNTANFLLLSKRDPRTNGLTIQRYSTWSHPHESLCGWLHQHIRVTLPNLAVHPVVHACQRERRKLRRISISRSPHIWFPVSPMPFHYGGFLVIDLWREFLSPTRACNMLCDWWWILPQFDSEFPQA